MHYIIANETRLKGKGRKILEAVKSVFDRAEIAYKVLLTHVQGDAKKIAEEVTADGNENTLVAMGGDGTLHDIINGFKDFEKCSLGLVPIGTGNDFASCAKIPTNAVKAAELIAYGKPRHIDFIELSSGLRSINSVGMGIDVDVLKRTYSGNKHGKGKYLRSLISSLIHFKSCNFTVRYDDKEEKHYGLIAACGNGKFLGGGINLFPEAKIDGPYYRRLHIEAQNYFGVCKAYARKSCKSKERDFRQNKGCDVYSRGRKLYHSSRGRALRQRSPRSKNCGKQT